MNLIEQLNKVSRKNEPLAWQEYYKVLRDGRVDDAELPKLKDLMFSLGKTKESLELDLGAIAFAKDLRQKIEAGSKLMPAIDANSKQRQKHTEEADAIKAKLDAELNALLAERQQLTAARDDAKTAIVSLQKLYDRNPALFHSERRPEIEDID